MQPKIWSFWNIRTSFPWQQLRSDAWHQLGLNNLLPAEIELPLQELSMRRLLPICIGGHFFVQSRWCINYLYTDEVIYSINLIICFYYWLLSGTLSENFTEQKHLDIHSNSVNAATSLFFVSSYLHNTGMDKCQHFMLYVVGSNLICVIWNGHFPFCHVA